MREKASPRGIRVYVCGAGVGESLLLGLPGGEWGLIDCYLPSASAAAKMLAVLSKLGVNRLTFVCLTHPHYDHYSGLHYVLNEYAGRIDNIWRHPGLSARDSIARVLLAAKIRSRRNSDPEADKLADGYLKVLEAIDAATKDMPHEQYIRVVGPRLLLERKSYKLEALGPSSSLLDIVEGNIGKINTNDGCLLFVTGRIKTSHVGAIQNQPVVGRCNSISRPGCPRRLCRRPDSSADSFSRRYG